MLLHWTLRNYLKVRVRIRRCAPTNTNEVPQLVAPQHDISSSYAHVALHSSRYRPIANSKTCCRKDGRPFTYDMSMEPTHRMYHLADQPIPAGYRLFADRLEVAGITHHRTDAEKFIRSERKWLEFRRELGNPHDPNAIEIMGCTQGLFGVRRRPLGYIPRETAKAMVDANVDGIIRPRLLKTYISPSGFLEILFQIIGPKESFDAPIVPEPKDGAHYTEFVPRIEWLKRVGRDEEAISVLLKLVDEVEDESERKGWGAAPWYYEQLAILFRKQNRPCEEMRILERYERQKKAPGASVQRLMDRLARLRESTERESR